MVVAEKVGGRASTFQQGLAEQQPQRNLSSPSLWVVVVARAPRNFALMPTAATFRQSPSGRAPRFREAHTKILMDPANWVGRSGLAHYSRISVHRPVLAPLPPDTYTRIKDHYQFTLRGSHRHFTWKVNHQDGEYRPPTNDDNDLKSTITYTTKHNATALFSPPSRMTPR